MSNTILSLLIQLKREVANVCMIIKLSSMVMHNSSWGDRIFGIATLEARDVGYHYHF